MSQVTLPAKGQTTTVPRVPRKAVEVAVTDTSELVNRLLDRAHDLLSLIDKVKEVERKCDQLCSQVDEVNGSIDAAIADLQSKIDAANTKLDSKIDDAHLNRNIDAAKAELNSNIGNATQYLNDNIDAAKAELNNNIGNATQYLNGNIDAAKEELNLNNWYGTEFLKGEINAARADLNGNIDAAKAELNGNIDAAKAELNGNIGAAKAELNSNIDAAKDEMNGNIDAAKVDLENRVKALEEGLKLIQTPSADLAKEAVVELRKIAADNVELQRKLNDLMLKRPDVLVEIAKLLELDNNDDKAILTAMRKVAINDGPLLSRIIVSAGRNH